MARHAQITQNKKSAISLQHVKKVGVMQLIFGMQISMKACYKLILRFFDGNGQVFPNFFTISQMDANKYQSFLQVDFKTWGNKVSYRVILSLLMGMIKHSHSTQSNKLAISLQYLQKEVRNEVPFLYADKQKKFYNLDYCF